MLFSWISFFAVFCQIAVLSPAVQCLTDEQCCQPVSRSCYQSKGRVIYHQTMTPLWLEAHASYIDSSRKATAEQVTFNAASITNVALLKVPIIPAGVLGLSTPLTVEITVANDVSIGKKVDSDVRYGVSDGNRFVGFQVPDIGNYPSTAPCYGVEGTPGMTLTGIRLISHTSPRPSDSFYPGQYVITLKLDKRWGSCFTAHDGGFVKTAGYSNRLMLSKGLTFEVYKEDAHDRVAIKYIKVAVTRDDLKGSLVYLA